MKLFVIIATVVACACAAPTVELQHLSPVNPSVLVELKPEDKIMLITDPKEIAKFKRETKKQFFPTVLPEEHVHHITKRDHKPGHDALTKRNRRNVESYQKSEDLKTKTDNDNKETHQDNEDDKKVTAEVYQKPQSLPATFSNSNKATQELKSDIPLPLVPKHHHHEECSKESTEEEKRKHKTEVFQKPQGLPAIFSPQPQKRDIPVPLFPKHHHPEESTTDIDEKETREVHTDDHYEHKTLQAHVQDHVAVEGYEKTQTLPLIFKNTQQQKRDIPVPLVPKHQDPEESPKESNERKTHEDKKEISGANPHVHQTLQAHTQHPVTVEGFEKPQTFPLNLRETPEDTQQHKRDIPVPLVPKHQHPAEEKNGKESHEEKKEFISENHHEVQTLSSHNQQYFSIDGKPQSLSLTVKDNPEDTQQHKRDIPVALVAKYQHPEESQKENSKKEDQEDKNQVNTENRNLYQTMTAHNHDHVTTVEIEKPQVLPASLKESVEDTQQHKRDIPVSLVPKHHHPEDSLKDSNENESHKDKKEEKSENHQIPQTLQLREQENIFKDGQQRSQFTSSIDKTKGDNSQQQTRDTSVLKEGSLKDNSNEKELHEQRKEDISENHHVPQIHQLSHTLPTYSNEHLNTQGIHKPQVLPAFNHDHISQSSSEKSQISSNHQDITNKKNEKSEGDIQIHHISQTLPGHIHKRLAMEGLQNPQIQNQENIEGISLHKPQAMPTHHYEHIPQEGVQKPQTTSDILKQTTDAIHHQKSKVSGPVVVHHQEETQKESNENHKYEIKSTGNHPNIHEVQVEDLSKSKPYQQPIHHALVQSDHKPNIPEDHLSAQDFTTSTTDHPVLRPRPVPVAELFARAHDN